MGESEWKCYVQITLLLLKLNDNFKTQFLCWSKVLPLHGSQEENKNRNVLGQNLNATPHPCIPKPALFIFKLDEDWRFFFFVFFFSLNMNWDAVCLDWLNCCWIKNLIVGTNIQQYVWFLNITTTTIGSEHSFHVPKMVPTTL